MEVTIVETQYNTKRKKEEKLSPDRELPCKRCHKPLGRQMVDAGTDNFECEWYDAF